MLRSTLLFLTVLWSATTTASAQIALAKTCCGLMSGKVYCYGGIGFTSPTETKVENTLLALDITSKTEVYIDDLQDMWTNIIYNANGVDLTPREDPQCLVITEQNRMIINGGYETTGSSLKNANILYHALQNKWFANNDYVEPNFSKRQIYYGSASYVPDKGAAFYGGYEEHVYPNWGLYKTNTTLFTFANNASGTIGYPSVTYYNVENVADPWNRPATLTDAYDQFSAKHQSVFDPATKMLLFMGGEYRLNNPASHDAILRPYNRIKAFYTETNIWSFIDLTGDMPEPGRLYSTLTLLPSTNQHVMLYGGENNDKVALDYCFILNLVNRTWTKQTINAPNGTILSRSRHSAVSVDKNTVFIMWGIDSNNAGTRSMLILDTTDPYAIKLSDKYTASDDGNLKPFVVQGISDGLKAGIALASAAVLALGALSIWFCIRNKKRNRKIKEQEREIAKRQQESEYYNRTDVEPMEVDWDVIENKCTEMSTADTKGNVGAIFGNETSTTLVSRVETPSATAEVILPDVETHQPNTIDSSEPPRVLKPDGAQ
ncbi:hypothetical protein BD408DRAFT_480918 [Parasitella parasitica]|nr:hypothetical protein BD408DRAFT_480918 [Parasitella parasitica]